MPPHQREGAGCTVWNMVHNFIDQNETELTENAYPNEVGYIITQMYDTSVLNKMQSTFTLLTINKSNYISAFIKFSLHDKITIGDNRYPQIITEYIAFPCQWI